MATPPEPGDEMCAEYDFSKSSGAVRGKYAAGDGQNARAVLLDKDVAAAFADGAAVNAALREYLRSRGDKPMPD